MSSPSQPPDDPASKHEFDRALAHLIQTARANDVEVTGGYEYPTQADPHDYGIEIYRVTSTSETNG